MNKMDMAWLVSRGGDSSSWDSRKYRLVDSMVEREIGVQVKHDAEQKVEPLRA